MALHISYHSDNAYYAALRAANMGGDCDTFTAIVGQIVGSYYGSNKEMLALYKHITKFDQYKYKCAYIALKLYNICYISNFCL